MAAHYFKYKALALTPEGELDERTLKQVIEPVAESYFYLPTRERLNDPNEGVFQNQIQEVINRIVQSVHSIGERTELTQAFLDLARQINQSTDNSGVFSLSSNVTDELMWAHYAASHFGIAIEYDINELTRFCSKRHLHFIHVNYVESPPKLNINQLQENAKEAVITMLGHKSPRWNYEEESRVVLDNMHGSIPHDYRAIKSITYGLKVSPEIQQKVYVATKHKVPEYYQICKVQDSYLLDRKKLELFLGSRPTGSIPSLNWEEQFKDLDAEIKGRLIKKAQEEIANDPHFEELLMAEKSTNDPSKAVLQYQAKHNLGLDPWGRYTKHYFDL